MRRHSVRIVCATLVTWGLNLVAATPPATERYLRLPLAFERQTDGKQDSYTARGNGYAVGLRDGNAVIGVQPGADGAAARVSMEFAGGRHVIGAPSSELPGKVNYIRGNDPKQWRYGLPTYERVTYEGVYPGVDVVYYGSQRQLEFDLVLKPGADPSKVRLRFSGAGPLKVGDDGGLVIECDGGVLRVPLPAVYQEFPGGRHAVEASYALIAGNEVAFRVNAYDRTKPLVIDPTIVYSGLLIGDQTGTGYGERVAVDSSDNVYVAGYTSVTDFATVNPAFPQYSGSTDGFVEKINAAGTAVLYSTYIGGRNTENLYGIAVDSAGEAWVTGQTNSPDFPVSGGAYQSTLAGTGNNAVVLKLSATGSLLYSTFLAGTGGSNGYAMAVDSAGSAYAAGSAGLGFPTTTGAYLTTFMGGSTDGFLAKFSPSGSLTYATYVGGAAQDWIYGVAVDSSGSAYVAGQTYSNSFPNAPTGGAQSSFTGGTDAFVAKVNASGSALSYFTYLGGAGSAWANAIAVDVGGNAFFAGGMEAFDVPTTPGVLQPTSGIGAGSGLDRIFVAKLNAAGSAFLYVTCLDGNRFDYLSGLAIDSAGNAIVTGRTDSDRFPSVNAVQGTLLGNPTGLFQTTNAAASWSAFDANLPGEANAVSVDPSNSNTIVASTEGGTFRTTDGGASWSYRSGSSLSYLSRSPANSATIYGSTGASVYQSTDGGLTWAFEGSVGTPSLTGIMSDPLTANTVYAFYASTSYPSIYKSTNGGTTWMAISTANGLPAYYISALAATPDGSLYAAVYSYGVYKSVNQGGAWTLVNTGLPSSFYPAINGLTASAASSSVLYVNAGAIYKTTDGAAHWAATSGQPPVSVYRIAVSPLNASAVYALASYSPTLYLTTDGGATWNPAATGLGIASLSQIAFDPSNGSVAYVTALVIQSAFISKLNASGTALIYSTYWGGVNGAAGYGIATTSAGDAVATGFFSNSQELTPPLPTTSAALQGSPYGNPSAFIVRIADATAACSYQMAPNGTDYIPSQARYYYYSVSAPSGCSWTASSDSSWAPVVMGASGTGTGLVAVSVAADTTSTGSSRTANITAGGQTAQIVQSDTSCSATLSPSSAAIPAGGGVLQVNVGVKAGCAWHVWDTDTAISVVSGAVGTGSGAVTLSVAANPNPNSRTLSPTIANSNVTITQAGTCSYSLSPASALFNGAGGTGSVALTAAGTGCTWSASSSNTSWLTVTSAASGTGGSVINFSAAAGTGASRSATLTIAGLSFTVTQAGDQAYLISTYAGARNTPPPVTVTGTGTVLPGFGYGAAADAAGNVYFSSSSQNVVFKLDTSGLLTRVAGVGSSGYSGDGGSALAAQLNAPNGVAVDADGNVYIADSGNHRIRKVSTSGIITTVAGLGVSGFSGDGGQATFAQLYSPRGVAVDGAGNLYIADYNNYRIRMVNAAGIISTVAGNGSYGYSGDGGPATSASMTYPYGVAVDGSGNLYIADSNNYRVRMVNSAGIITTAAGNGTYGYSGDGGPATGASIRSPYGLAVDGSGNLYIADSTNYRIRKVSTSGTITTVAGNGSSGFSGDGGSATSAVMTSPYGVAVDASGNIYIEDSSNYRVREVNAAGTIATVAGGFVGDGGNALLAGLSSPAGVAKDSAGNVYVADSAANRVRMIAPNGIISTLAGTGVAGYSGDGGAATSAQLNNPYGVAVDSAGNVYIADFYNSRVRMVSPGGTITTIAGTGVYSYSGDGGAPAAATFRYVSSVAVDASGNLYIGDYANYRVRKVSGGVIATVAGNGSYGFSGDGGAATSAMITYPYGLAVDASGNLFIADSSNYRVRKVTASGIISTYAGTGSSGYSGDGGPATSANVYYPEGVAVDSAGNLFIADNDNYRIRKVNLSGTIYTVAGGSYGYSGDGGPAISAAMTYPWGIAVDSSGNIYFGDSSNAAVRMLTPAGGTALPYLTSAHTGNFTQGQNGATYTLTAGNAQGAGATSGTVTVTELLPAGLALASMNGTGWTCTSNSCTRSDALAGGASYPPITVAVNVAANAAAQLTNLATITGGGGALSGAADLTLVGAGAAPAAPTLLTPANSATGISLAPYLMWNAAGGAASYDVYFGTAPTPLLAANTTITTFPAAGLTPGTTYHWQVASRNGAGTAASSTWSFTTTCISGVSPLTVPAGFGGTSGTVAVTALTGCGWTATSNAVWITITSGSAGSGNGSTGYTVAANTGGQRTGTVTIAGQTLTVTQASSPLATTNYSITTLAGGLLQPATALAATSASLPVGYGAATDAMGNLYFPIPTLNTVFRVDTSGVLTRIAGTGAAGSTGDGGAALGAMLNNPNGVAVDPLGNVYIADTSNYRIRKVSTSGLITTVAGTGSCCYAGDGGAATSAYLSSPYAVAVDASGNLYIGDTNNYRIRKVNTSGIISTYAGTGTSGYSGDGGAATSAQISGSRGLAVDSSGNLYIGDYSNYRVRMVSASTGIITTVAGTGSSGYSGDGGSAIGATLYTVFGVAVDPAGNLYIGDSGNRVRKVDTTGTITTVAGNGSTGFSGDGGAATSAQLWNPYGVAADASGNLYILDDMNLRIRKVSGGIITTFAGGGTGDGASAPLAGLNYASGVARDAAGNTYIADTYNNRIRKVNVNGNITTYAGTGVNGYSGDGGAATSAKLYQPYGVALDSAGNVYIADTSNYRIRKVDTSGNITTVAGTGSCCYSGDGGAATSAYLSSPYGVTVDSAGNLYIADTNNHRIRKVTSSGTISTFAGTGSGGYSGDGGAATSAQIYYPRAVTLDSAGNLYIADASNYRIRKVDTSGNISTVAGTGSSSISGDGGTATSAAIGSPVGIAVDSRGDLYISASARVRKVDVSGTITTVAGTGSSGYTGDGGLASAATFRSPYGLAVDASGNVYVADQTNNAVRLLTPAAGQAVLTIQSSHTGSFTQGQSGATYSLTVANATLAGPASGTVTVAETLPTGLTVTNMAGTGWTCTVSTAACTRSDRVERRVFIPGDHRNGERGGGSRCPVDQRRDGSGRRSPTGRSRGLHADSAVGSARGARADGAG